LLANVARSLKPQGRIGVIDFKVEGGGPGPDLDERVDPDDVVADAARAGLRMVGSETFLQYQYFLIFAK
jgi:predicted methyltransferase